LLTGNEYGVLDALRSKESGLQMHYCRFHGEFEIKSCCESPHFLNWPLPKQTQSKYNQSLLELVAENFLETRNANSNSSPLNPKKRKKDEFDVVGHNET
jgi:hypothetical protein